MVWLLCAVEYFVARGACVVKRNCDRTKTESGRSLSARLYAGLDVALRRLGQEMQRRRVWSIAAGKIVIAVFDRELPGIESKKTKENCR